MRGTRRGDDWLLPIYANTRANAASGSLSGGRISVSLVLRRLVRSCRALRARPAAVPSGTMADVRVLLFTLGSRGDVEPFIALGIGPAGGGARGHAVRQPAV
jgi:hypothetical protein